MIVIERKQAIESALTAFGTQPLYEAGMGLLDSLGYRSDRTIKASGLQEFRHIIDQRGRLQDSAAKTSDWTGVEFLRQINIQDVSNFGNGVAFQREFKPTEIQSYVFLIIELKEANYNRTDLSQVTRAVNRAFDMPAMILFKYGSTLTLAIIKRRLHKRDEARDVLEKVTLIKDIAYSDPVRAHIEILHDLSVDVLYQEFSFRNFTGLHLAWEKRLASYALNERFYREVANWYFWALTAPGVVLPRFIESIRNTEERDKQRSIFFIRLLTRLIFCWFLQEKGFLPRDLFRHRNAGKLLKDVSDSSGTYYKAILQNLFFATLNQEQERRDWGRKYPGSRDGNRGVTNLWRYHDLLTSSDKLEELLRDQVPFINGGLFDCLDEVHEDSGTANVRLDDFSEEKDNRLCLPNDLFFGGEREVDLSNVYESARHRKAKVSGLIEILGRYKFTVEENTPLEEEIALDPELLGKVFENLLASYNEDTRTTARKALGGFYTPREIVGYMVDESLLSYLATQVPSVPEHALRSLFMADTESPPDLSPSQRAALVGAIGDVKILDPACGSGAFPMGALHKLVDLLQKLDPNNESWKRDRLADAENYHEYLRQTDAPIAERDMAEARIEDIQRSFDTRFHALDFARKLYLIENCIYGVDIQPIAGQIAKLRFFIALLVDQHLDLGSSNLGVRPLPNLETKIVSADSLTPLRQPNVQLALLEQIIKPLREELEQVRHDHFNARTPARKARCRERDSVLRAQIAKYLRECGMAAESANALAAWDPYDQNHSAAFFDSEWMFGLPVGKVQSNGASTTTLRGSLSLVNDAGEQMELPTPGEHESGFDIVIGNPPYVRIQTLKQKDPALVEFYKQNYDSAKKGSYDLYVVFVEAGLKFLKPDGHLAYIMPHKFFNAKYGEPLRGLLAKGRHLRHVVHFGDQQVFPGASNYVCLLFLEKTGAEVCHFVRVEDLDAWLETFDGIGGDFPAKTITAAEWNFAVGRGADVFEKLRNYPRKLADVATRIYQGPITSADSVYLFKDYSAASSQMIRAFSKELDEEVDLEASILKPVVRSGDIGPYWASPKALVLFPYEISGTVARLLTASELENKFPRAWSYLKRNQTVLESRENDKFNDSQWYRFGRTQNLGRWEQPKLMIPYMISHLGAFLDTSENYYFINVTTGGYGLTTRTEEYSLPLVCGLLNSPVLDFFLKRVSTNFRGGYFAANKQYIEQLPIADVRDSQDEIIARLVGYLLWSNRYSKEHAEEGHSRDTVMVGYWEQVLNGLVYELYFPDELHKINLHLFDLINEARLPALDDLPETQRLSSLRYEFERIYDLQHPIRSALHDLQTVEEVRIIEGKA